MGYDCGTAAGLMAGAFTESTVIGTAGDAIGRLPISDAEKTRLLNNIPVAYAVSYLVGTGFVVWFLSSLAPRLLGFDLAAEGRALEGSMTAKTGAGLSAYREWDKRAWRVTNPAFDGRRVRDVEASFAPERVFIERLRRNGSVVTPDPETVLGVGDVVAMAGRRSVLVTRAPLVGEEVADAELLDVPVVTADVVVTNRTCADCKLADLAAEHGRGVVLEKLVRGGEEIPFNAETIVHRGDLLRVVGNPADVERVGRTLGYTEPPTSETDIVFVGLGILIGGFVGLLTIRIGGVPLHLTASGGA